MDVAIFQNGSSSLPVRRSENNIVSAGGTVEEVHEDCQRLIKEQVEQGVLADELGYDYFFLTEHHFQNEGAEFSPCPLQSGTAIAVQTDTIRLGQMANIIVWHHPVRFAEQAAILDILSDGRAEIGVGRGYQPRENETFGRAFGSTVQDQERNRKSFHEVLELIKRCWTEGMVEHRGENFSIPPSYTKWNNAQTESYFRRPEVEYDVEEVLDLGEPDMYSGGNPVVATTTTLKKISVFPQPLQDPHPQLWEPLTSPRSIKFCARHGINGCFIVEPNSRLKKNIEIYYEEAEKHDWPDYQDRGKFKFGWDSEKKRGVITMRHMFINNGKNDDAHERYKEGLELAWDYYGKFGFASVLAEADEEPLDPNQKVDHELLHEKEVSIDGEPDEVIEKILRIKEDVGYEDFAFGCWFETGGLTGKETEEQMHLFAEEVMPVLREEVGGTAEPAPAEE